MFALVMKTWEQEREEENLVLFKSLQLHACDEIRETEDTTPVELQEIIKKFVPVAVRTKNGKEYERSSRKSLSKAATGIFVKSVTDST